MDSKILIVFEENGHSAMRLFRKAAALAGIDLDKIHTHFICNAAFDNDSWMEVLASSYTAKAKMLDDLREKIKFAQPNIMVVVGEQALQHLTGLHGIEKWRGSIIHSKVLDVKTMGVQKGSWIIRGNVQAFWYLVNDLTRAKAQSTFPEIRTPQWSNIIGPTATEAVEFLDAVPDNEKWSFDIETRANHLACFSVAYSDRAMCIPIQNPDGPHFMPPYEAAIYRALDRLMRRNSYLVGQNLTFDLDYMFDYGLEPRGIWMDTMISHAILYPEFPKGLDFLVSMYTEMPYHKAEGKISNPNITTEGLWSYNNKDTITTLWCANEIEKQLRERKLWPVHEFVTKELSIALEMQRIGIQVDPAKKAELSQWIGDEEKELDAMWNPADTMRRLACQPPRNRPNVNSPLQVRKFLYQDLGLPTKTRMGSTVSDEQAINELKARNPELVELDWILRERHLRKLQGSYLNAEGEPNGTISASWCVHGTETGRWSSGKNRHGRGFNLQTAPKSMRWMFVPYQEAA